MFGRLNGEYWFILINFQYGTRALLIKSFFCWDDCIDNSLNTVFVEENVLMASSLDCGCQCTGLLRTDVQTDAINLRTKLRQKKSVRQLAAVDTVPSPSPHRTVGAGM